MRQWEQQRETWDADALEPISDFIAAADRVVVRFIWHAAGHGPESNVELTAVYRVRNGRFLHQEFFWDHADALQAVGLREWAMSQENVELAHRLFDAVNRDDLDAALALMVDDVEAVPRLAAMEGGYHGHDGMRRWWENLHDGFPDFSIEVVEVRDLGERTLAHLSVRGHGAGSDAPFEQTIWHVAEWRDQEIVRWSAHGTEAEALEAVGLRE